MQSDHHYSAKTISVVIKVEKLKNKRYNNNAASATFYITQ